MNNVTSVSEKSSWHGPKQVGIMIFSGLLMLIGTCLVGGSTNTILPFIAEVKGWDVGFLRTMAGIGVMFVVVGTFVFGTIIKKKGVKVALGISLILSAIFTVIYGLAPSLGVFVATIFILGFLSGGYRTSGANALVSNWWPTQKGVVMGFVSMGVILMDIVWNPFIPMAYARFGVAPTMAAVGVVVLIFIIIGLIVVKNTPEEMGEYPDGDNSNPENLAAVIKEMREYQSPFTFGKVFKQRAMLDIGVGLGLLYLVCMSYVASIVPRLLSTGYEYNFALIVLVVSGGVALLGSWAIGVLDQKIGTKRACLVYGFLLLIGIVLALFHGAGVGFVWSAGAIFSLGMGACCNLIPSYVGTVYGRWDYSAAYRVIGAITELFAGIGVMCTGLFHGNYTGMYIFNIVCICVALLILATGKDKLIGKAG
jgi:sugar phosphate permease